MVIYASVKLLALNASKYLGGSHSGVASMSFAAAAAGGDTYRSCVASCASQRRGDVKTARVPWQVSLCTKCH